MNHNSEPNSDKQSKSPDPKTTSSSWWRRLVLTLALLIVGGTGAGLIYGWYFIQRKLIPLIETETGNYLHRPLELGDLKTISLTGATFGNSALDATVDNPDFVEVEKVKVNFAPLYFLRTRQLKLALTLIEPNVYLEQDSSKLWTPTDFGDDEDSGGGIKVDVRSIQLEGGNLTLAAYNSEKAALNPAVKAEVERIIIRPQEQQIKFDAAAELVAGGRFQVDGQGNTQSGVIDLTVTAQDLDAQQISNLLALPIELDRGNLNGKLGVTLSDAPIPELNGKLNLDDVSLQIPNLVKPFSHSNGTIAFAGSKIKLNRVKTNFGEVLGRVSGSLDLAATGNYQLQTKVEPVAVSKVIEALELEAPVPIKGKIKGNVSVAGKLENPAVKFALTTTGASKVDKVDFQKIDADLELVGSTLTVRQFDSLPKTGGKISGNGKLEIDGAQNLAFNIFAQDVSGQAIARNYDNTLPFDIGLITGNTKISAQAGDLSTLRFQAGRANFALGNGVVKVAKLNYSRGKWSTQVTTSAVEFGSFPFGEGSAPTIARGLVDGKFQVSGTQDLGNLERLQVKGQADLKTVGGQVTIPKVKVANGSWQADTKTKNLKLQRLFPELPNEFNDNLSGEFYLTGNIPDEAQSQTRIKGKGDLELAQGRVKVEKLKIVDRNWTAIAQGTNLKLKQLSSTTPDQFAGLVNGQLKLAGTTDNISPDGIKARGEGSLTLPEGVFQAAELAIADGQFQALVTPLGVNLSLFADPNSDDLELNGRLGGQLEVEGAVDNLSPTAVSATGNLTFSEGIDLLEQPLGATIAWDGKRLDVLKAKGDGLDAQGYIVLDPSFFSDIPDKLAAVDYFEFDVPQANWIDIRKLRLTLPSWATNLNYGGNSDFTGKISGIPSAMQIEGDLNLRNFQVENIDFAPFLTGKVQISPATGVNLDLEEVAITPVISPSPEQNPTLQPLDRVELVLDRNFSPLTFGVVRDNIAVRGVGKQEILELTAQNIPVAFLKTVAVKSDDFQVPDNLALQPVSGELSGDFIFNLDTLATSGENVVVDNPSLDSIRGDRLEGNFQYADSYFAIQDAEFQQRNSIYKLEGNLIQKPDDLELYGSISINEGQIQDILVAMQIFELADLGRIFSDRNYGDAKDLYVPPPPNQPPLASVGLEDAAIIEQIRLLSEIQAWLEEIEQQRQNALIPPIKNLTGTFNGQFDVSGSLNRGLDSEFEFLGEQWQWGNLIGKKVVVKGNLNQGILTLLPISIQLQDNTVKALPENQVSSPTLLFTGTFGGEAQSGQFRLLEVPMKIIEQLFSLPPELGLDGLLNASASIAGTPENPKARGELSIDNASLNDTSIQSTKGSFNYHDARVKFFASSVVAQDADPLVIKGSIPYKLPSSNVDPQSDRLELQVNVKDKGLTLLDIVSRGELKWLGGEGEIVLDISGILDAQTNLPRQLVAQGVADIKQATVAARSLPKNSITNIDSQIFFDLDNIRVSSFEGDFGGGKILAAGTVPLSKDFSLNPLTIDFENIEIELPKLYNGGVEGRLQILGKATEPNITGQVTLYNGTILLDNEENESQPSKPEVIVDSDRLKGLNRRNTGTTDRGIAAATQYKNLKLKLGEDIEISQPPIFTFLATGDLNVNGTFLQPSPQGTIVLQRGQVNLFTTQLNLSRDYKNIARFSNNNVLDPFLDILLVGSALETTERTVPSEVLPTEIPDSFNLGTLETVRISAKVKGLASQITNKIELTSSPPRSQAEIAALLGGGVVEALGNSSGTLGLATLAGSALFGSLNSEFNDIFPIGELRLFPTQIIDEDRDDRRNDGLAGEIAFDLVDNFSFSVLKILNTDIPARYGFRYRLDNNFVLRGSSNFQEDGSRALIEFESRF